MDHRDDWPDEVLEGGLDSRESLDDQVRESIELIAGDGRRMDAVLAAMANRLSERLSVAELERAALATSAIPLEETESSCHWRPLPSSRR